MRKQRSIGEMISTVTFFGLSAYLLIFSLGLLEEGEKLRGRSVCWQRPVAGLVVYDL
jgi:hypothetical protein